MHVPGRPALAFSVTIPPFHESENGFALKRCGVAYAVAVNERDPAMSTTAKRF
jgi:hypothetical protein